MTDLHLSKNPEEYIFELVKPEKTFIEVLQLVRLEKPDIVLVTGDLSQDGSIESYQRLNNYFKTIKCFVYTIYGNHDNPENFDNWLICNNTRKEAVLKTPIGNFIFLSSFKPNSDSGYIDDKNIQHLILNFEKYNNCIPVIHHHFIPLNTVIDNFILENNEEFVRILKFYKSKIKFCMTGHVHNSYRSYLEDKIVYSSLSTCIQFAKTKELLFDNKKPGFTVYNFNGADYEVIEKTI